MPKISKIPNKTHTTLSVNRELLSKAKLMNINISLLLDAALERELNPNCKDAYFRALEKKIASISAWMEKNPSIEKDYYAEIEKKAQKGGEVNVLEKKRESSCENREDQGDIGRV